MAVHDEWGVVGSARDDTCARRSGYFAQSSAWEYEATEGIQKPSGKNPASSTAIAWLFLHPLKLKAAEAPSEKFPCQRE